MKVSTAFCGLTFGICAARAFPSVAGRVSQKRQTAPDPSTRFDPKTQYVSTTGSHAFVPPDFANGDVRGPCPGLNALANHGYLPHNGVGSHTDFIQGTFEGFGMSADLSGFLTILGATLDGDGLQWSIGGPSKYLPGTPPLLGAPQGISGSHNKYECDVSPGRGDLYTHGNDYELQMDQYQMLYNMAIANGDNIDLPLLTDFRSKRFDNSVQNNSYFFNGPFTGVEVQPAAFTFIFRFMGNKSAAYPQGRLNTKILNSFFGVTKNSDGTLTKQAGMERIPENWYKRAVGDEYSIPFFQADLLLAAQKYPKFLSVGGNLGKPNSFTGIDIGNLTGGVYNGATLAQGNNAACFASQFLTQIMPDELRCSGVVANIESALVTFDKQMNASFGQFDCPQIDKLDDSQFAQFPGYSKLNCKTGLYN